ncbi:MAG: hypothetical protein ACJA2J_000333 [Candidatus Azotimanducaceae bacterium]|jgi:hypothetical protein
MEAPTHSMVSLFNQLGLESTEECINKFIETKRHLAGSIELHEAPFWNASQASFLKEVVLDDADWVAIVNQLDASLR